MSSRAVLNVAPAAIAVSRILALYDSKTGDTAARAQFVADGAKSIPDTEVQARSLDGAWSQDVIWLDQWLTG